MNVRERLAGKVGPLPAYAWLLLTLAAYLYYRHRQAAAATTAGPGDQTSLDGAAASQPVPFYGSNFSDTGLGYASGSPAATAIYNYYTQSPSSGGGTNGGGGGGSGGSGGGSGGGGGSNPPPVGVGSSSGTTTQNAGGVIRQFQAV